MKGILGKKIGMTQVFKDNGKVIPVTVVKAGPCTVVQKKTEEIDDYSAVQLGFEDIKESKLNKPKKGHFDKYGVAPKRYVKEFKGEEMVNLEPGEEIEADIFTEGDLVDVTGTSKGKGFTGTVKRWNFNTGPKTHGSRNYRAPGSIAPGSADPSRVFKGKKMAGRAGRKKVTIQNLEVVEVDLENDLLLIKGSVPGPEKSLLTIREAIKQQ